MTDEAEGPFVACALLCERLEWRGKLPSILGITNQIHVARVPAKIKLSGALCFWSGGFEGSLPLKIVRRSPGETEETDLGEMHFTGHSMAALELGLTFGASEMGIHHFEVYLGGKLMTRIPLVLAPETDRPLGRMQSPPQAKHRRNN